MYTSKKITNTDAKNIISGQDVILVDDSDVMPIPIARTIITPVFTAGTIQSATIHALTNTLFAVIESRKAF